MESTGKDDVLSPAISHQAPAPSPSHGESLADCPAIERDSCGRFVAGHAGHPRAGRRRGQSINAELRRQGDPELIARAMLTIAFGNPAEYRAKDRADMLRYIADKLEGMPTRSTLVGKLEPVTSTRLSDDEVNALDEGALDELESALELALVSARSRLLSP